MHLTRARAWPFFARQVASSGNARLSRPGPMATRRASSSFPTGDLVMRSLFFGTTVVAIVASAASAQQRPQQALELRPFVGAYVPTGALRDAFKGGVMLGGQA